MKKSNESIKSIAQDLETKVYVVSIRSQFKLALVENSVLAFEKWEVDGVSYSVVQSIMHLK